MAGDEAGAISLCQIKRGLLDLVKELELHPKDSKGAPKVLNSTAAREYWLNSKVSSVEPWHTVHSTVQSTC